MRRWLIAVSSLALLGASLPWVLMVLIWWHVQKVEGVPQEGADVAIALGGDMGAERRSEAVRLCRRLGIPRLMATGDPELPPLSVPPPLQVEEVSLDFDSTAEEAAYYARRLQQEGIRAAVVVTSAAHCYRTDLLFRRVLGPGRMRLTVRPTPGSVLVRGLPLFEGVKLLLAVLRLDLPIHGPARGRLKEAVASWVP